MRHFLLLLLIFSQACSSDKPVATNSLNESKIGLPPGAVFYQVNPLVFSPQQNLISIEKHFDRLSELGISHLIIYNLLNENEGIFIVNPEITDEILLKSFAVSARRVGISLIAQTGFQGNLTAEMVDYLTELSLAGVVNGKDVITLVENSEKEQAGYFDSTYYNMLTALADREIDADSVSNYVLSRTQKISIPVNYSSRVQVNHNEGSVFERFGKASELLGVLTFLVPGSPMLMAGQEVGLKKALEIDQDSIPWGDHPFNSLYSRLGRLARDFEPLKTGDFKNLTTDMPKQVLAFRRMKAKQEIVCFFNLSPEKVTFKPLERNVPEQTFKSFKLRTDIDLDLEGSVELDAWGYEIYLID